ncbi:hypothetical protein, partial [Rhizobium sp. Pop5]|uniref:hypothetical protein n=1 Tax=Rhizobium sp. Pop5 TaxID=1223565 RepID=UPI00028373A0
ASIFFVWIGLGHGIGSGLLLTARKAEIAAAGKINLAWLTCFARPRQRRSSRSKGRFDAMRKSA